MVIPRKLGAIVAVAAGIGLAGTGWLEGSVPASHGVNLAAATNVGSTGRSNDGQNNNWQNTHWQNNSCQNKHGKKNNHWQNKHGKKENEGKNKKNNNCQQMDWPKNYCQNNDGRNTVSIRKSCGGGWAGQWPCVRDRTEPISAHQVAVSAGRRLAARLNRRPLAGRAVVRHGGRGA